MKKVLALILSLALIAALAVGCAPKPTEPAVSPDASDPTPPEAGGTLTLYTWEGMFPEEIIAGFEAETGITVNYAVFDTDETMLTKLETAKGGDYDLVIADDYIIELAVGAGLVQKLDKSKLSNYGNINPIYQGQFYDPADEYTVPYGAGVQTIVFDPNFVDIPVSGYADLLDPSFKDSVGVIGNYRVINGLALKILGYSYNTENLDEIDAAGAKLLELAPNIRVIKDDSLENDLISGEITAAVMYTSQVTAALLERPDLAVVYPAEGIGFGVMGSFIPSQAPNAEAAYKFLDYILDAQRGAECFEWLGYYSTFSASDAYISDEYKPFLTLPAEFGETEMIGNVSDEALQKHELIWTAFRDAAGK
ncbi:MAG: spermidine/putrescine ABC transporter substrate-binding protein [Oscillospiraceae bacterium]|nr:spermidine/putrescine ABC transporter substrate-binding protein [Oscillospiraceae bacterium]